MNKLIVTKFGGSSLSNDIQFKKVKDIILKDKNRQYIVVSAPGKAFEGDYKVTDLLYKCYSCTNNKDLFENYFNMIEKKYISICENLKIDIDIKKLLSEIRNNFFNGASKDYILSRGEYLNGLIFAKFINFKFIDPAEIIKFRENGTLDKNMTKILISKKLSHITEAIIPGFYGSTKDGSIKTFPRGGSDITGSIISSVMNASLYENWTDVSGVLLANPHIIDNPKVIKYMTYSEIKQLSHMGAEVLNEDSIAPVKKKGIPISIKNTNRPYDIGTIISDNLDNEDNENIIAGISAKRNYSIITLSKSYTSKNDLNIIFSIFDDYNINIEYLSFDYDSVSLIVPDLILNTCEGYFINGIKTRIDPTSICIKHDISLVGIVIRDVNKYNDILYTSLKNLSYQNIDIEIIIQSSSSYKSNIILGIKDFNSSRAIKSLYKSINNINSNSNINTKYKTVNINF
ncbi:aspartate kinase [Clostridium fermenticellae]|uniref:Aspartate kinase n=1 Tax=Clostridium fermenticellae TaxID=2068654 RepID=A0A386H4U7_9CLOT|nr:aspartate kinase [Clostridium fermenticellae]AYD40771.1 aspartate kinase [Clostridium fermenticellae]